MKNSFQSHLLKGLITIFIVLSLIGVIFVIPLLTAFGLESYPEMEPVALFLQLGTQLLLALFILGLVLIIYLLILFDKGQVFSHNFTKALNTISILCFVAVIGLMIMIVIVTPYGGPGPSIYFLIALILTIIIIGLALSMFSKVINQAIEYKLENELTV